MKIYILLLFLCFCTVNSYSLQFGTVNLGHQTGKKAIKEWKEKNPQSQQPQPQDDPRLYWISEKMDGFIYWPSIAISGDTIYVGTSGWDNRPPGVDYTNAVYSLDKHTGKIKARYLLSDDELVKGAIVIGKSGCIYFMVIEMTGYNEGYGKTYLYSLNQDLQLRWKKEVSLTQPNFWGQASPAVDSQENLYINVCVSTSIPPIYAIISYDFYGNERWRHEFRGLGGGVVWPTPVVASGIVFANTCNGIYALTTSTGGVLWYIQHADGDIVSPVITDNTLYVIAGLFGKRLLAYTLNGELKWEMNTYAKTLAQPVIGEDGTIYFGTTAKEIDRNVYPDKIAGFFWAINPSTGGAKWMFDIDEYMYDEYDKKYKSSDIYAPAVVGKDGTIYFTTEYRYIFALNPDGKLKEKYDLMKMARGWPGGTVTYSALVIDENGVLYKADSNRDPVLKRDVARVIAIKTQSYGLANSPWPKGYRNYSNTNAQE
ncbi:MAG: PQQ-binding-like beta-propeller repeat protein [Endomicrobia bacterium]|nr:PQQ-binding-like beta-propeller repeat protein [Endomicrobiia bacterium]